MPSHTSQHEVPYLRRIAETPYAQLEERDVETVTRFTPGQLSYVIDRATTQGLPSTELLDLLHAAHERCLNELQAS
ncbi:MAG: hypothetical protein JWL89_190 [Candidatus Saccharibacteria bacterium]|nr:hypothetical protein [Candidatus Saccharibacteria bacterium]